MIETQPHERQDVSRHIRQQNADNKRVGLDLGKSSVVKPRSTRSKVWEDFVKYQDENGKAWARCKVCKKDFDGSSKLGTTHLRNHFESCQRKRNGGGGGDNLASSLSDTIAIKEKFVMDQQLNHLDAARMVIKQGDASLINSTNVSYIVDVYKEEKEKLRNYFEKLSCHLCLTICDMGYSRADYSCLMVWFIDDDWKLKNKIIGLKYFKDDETVINEIKNVLLEWGIENNLSSVVIDGDRDCNLSKRDDWFNNQGSLLFKNKLLCSQTLSSSFECIDHFFDHLAIRSHLYESLTRLVNNVSETSSRNENFRNAIDVAIKSLGADVIPTSGDLFQRYVLRADSYLLGVLKIVLRLKETFFDLEHIHPHFQILTKEEWDVLRAFYEYSEDLGHGGFLRQYCSNYHTANTHFPLLCRIYKRFKELMKYKINNFCNDFIERADNAWCEYNLVLAVASVLDPRFKMDIVKNWYKIIFADEWETEFTKFTDYFTNIYNEYARDINNFKSCTSGSEETNSSISCKMLDPLGKPCESSHEPNHVQLLNSELHLYLEEVKFASFEDFDILEWWRVHARYFPTLARMARDFLSIQISSHPLTVLEDEMDCAEASAIAEGYICTKSWLAT